MLHAAALGTLSYPNFGPSVVAANGAHPIFNGPFTPPGTSFTGSYFSHVTVSGTGVSPIILRATEGDVVLGEQAVGSADLAYDPSQANNTAILELNVRDAHDPDSAPPHESYINSIAPVSVSLKQNTVEKRHVVVGNGDVGETGGHDISVTVQDGDCPPGVVGTPDLDPLTAGAQNMTTVKGGRTAGGLLPLTINTAAFSTPNGKAPARCTATITASGPAGDTDGSNNATKLVIDVTDQNDF